MLAKEDVERLRAVLAEAKVARTLTRAAIYKAIRIHETATFDLRGALAEVAEAGKILEEVEARIDEEAKKL